MIALPNPFFTETPSMEISTQIRIQQHGSYWYTVEDADTEMGGNGCTVSIWADGERDHYICMDKEAALAVADAIYKLFKN